MEFFLEDPTYVAGFLGLMTASAFMALRITQQGKYLYWALGALASTVGVLALEHFWITQNERVERVVYQLRQAVLASDIEGVLTHLTPDVEFVQGGTVLSGETTRTLIRENLAKASFDFIHVNDLQASAGRQTRRGKAEFRVYAKGTFRTPLATFNMGTANSTWSLGFEETSPRVWKVSRITPMSVPEGAISVPRSGPSSTALRREAVTEGRRLVDPAIHAGRKRRSLVLPSRPLAEPPTAGPPGTRDQPR